jgi:hypothetical protein
VKCKDLTQDQNSIAELPNVLFCPGGGGGGGGLGRVQISSRNFNVSSLIVKFWIAGFEGRLLLTLGTF